MENPAAGSSEDQEDQDNTTASLLGMLIPGLPDELSELCLLRLPFPHQSSVRTVSSSWNRAIINPYFLLSKRALSLSLPYIFVFALHNSTATIEFQMFDPLSSRWRRLPPMPDPSCATEFVCTSLPHEGKLFVLVGSSMRIYRPFLNQWSLASPVLAARTFFAAGIVNDKIIAVGRRRESFTDVQWYDQKSDTWMEGAKMRTELALHNSAVVENRLYVAEEWTWPIRSSPRGCVYDSVNDTWQDMSDGMRAGCSGSSVVVGDRLFVVLPYGERPLKVYDPDDDTWYYVGGEMFSREVIRRPFAVCGVEGKIYVVASGLNVAIGRVFGENNKDLCVTWEVVIGPECFCGFSPVNCQVLYA